MISRRIFCAVAVSLCLPLPAFAQAWPAKSIKMVVPYSAGGGTDGTARLIATRIGNALGQSVVVENRPGGGGMIGADFVAKSPADGYTVLFDAAPFAVNPALRKTPFDAKKDFIPVSLVMTAPNVLVVPAGAPYKTVKEFLAYAKANPGKLTYASAGTGTGQHLAGELFNVRTRADLLHVPYKGGGPALIDLLGGQVNSYFGNAASVTQYISNGRLIPLGVTSAKRSARLPDVPTVMEQGVNDYEVVEWAGVFLPAGTPQAIVERLAKEVRAAVEDADIRSKMEVMGVTPVGSTSAEFAKFVDSELARWSALIKANNIKAD
jgi:tripartite-type tricarboxylate transporter receptor subunit TctC